MRPPQRGSHLNLETSQCLCDRVLCNSESVFQKQTVIENRGRFEVIEKQQVIIEAAAKEAVIPKEPNRMMPHQKSETKSSETTKSKIDFWKNFRQQEGKSAKF